jgi:hypothetical protein
MNIGAMLVLVKLFQDAVGSVSPIGPPAPKDEEIPTTVPIKPICGPGQYAYQHPIGPNKGLWSCLVIPKGR